MGFLILVLRICSLNRVPHIGSWVPGPRWRIPGPGSRLWVPGGGSQVLGLIYWSRVSSPGSWVPLFRYASSLSLSFFQKRFLHWCFPDSYLKFLTTTFLKGIAIRKKKHCCKTRDHISIANLIRQLLIS